jgi:DNA-binding NarL/FixJ family response regulator
VSTIRVVLADDHALVLEGLRSMIDAEPDMEVVSVAGDGEALVAAIRRERPDVAVVDIEMPAVNGLRSLERIREEQLAVRVLVLTAYSDGATLRAALDGGADGFAVKTDPPRHTIDAIRNVHRGQLAFPIAARRWLTGQQPAGSSAELTDRERQVLHHVAEGLTNLEIASRLRVSDSTIKFHLQNIYLKLGVSNRTEAAAHYLKHSRSGPDAGPRG